MVNGKSPPVGDLGGYNTLLTVFFRLRGKTVPSGTQYVSYGRKFKKNLNQISLWKK